MSSTAKSCAGPLDDLSRDEHRAIEEAHRAAFETLLDLSEGNETEAEKLFARLACEDFCFGVLHPEVSDQEHLVAMTNARLVAIDSPYRVIPVL